MNASGHFLLQRAGLCLPRQVTGRVIRAGFMKLQKSGRLILSNTPMFASLPLFICLFL